MGLPTDPQEVRALADVIAADVLASRERTFHGIRRVAQASIATLRPDLKAVVTVNRATGLVEIDIRERGRA